ncbi:MAG: uracil-DNA glycosylase family protein, partial [Gemmatimonadaceae bacterium]
ETPSETPSEAPGERGARPAAGGGPTDWRAALRATGSAPDQLRASGAAGSSPRSRADDAAIARPGPGEAGNRGAGMEPSPAPGAAASGEGRASSDAAAADAAAARPGRDWGIPGLDVPVGHVVGRGEGELFGGPVAALQSLDEIAAAVAKCQRCSLYATALNPVPGEGSPTAQLMCVGEAPGQHEDETGRPFVGAAGQLLTKILAAIKLERDEVFIANVLKHRPPANRNPRPDEVAACSPYLVRQLELVRPKVIIAFGTFAAQTLLNTKDSIGKLRGSVHRYYGTPLVVTYHPAALLRNEAWKRPTWEDVKLARRILDLASGP